MTSFLKHLTVAAALACALASSGLADTLAQPQDTVVLTVSGDITATNSGETAQFDIEMLSQIDPTTIETTTIWTDGPQVFEGVALNTLLTQLGVTTGTIVATAINDYSVEIPVSDAVAGGPMIAYKMNGATMSVRDKGPLWIVYPYDSRADYRTEVVYSRSIWQLDRLAVVQ
ncbi:molybdopterin-dependent oxidoreductase [Yoonia sp. SS1-5]|uniref:Molybdopterin-dependent oxidoreductase n=1 Tax=Yoonia rhodophyticola TaxID=3137370 RepID=A0AAN0ML67_9RHOB